MEEVAHSEAESSTRNLQMGTIDSFNIDYMRTGGTAGGQPKTTRDFFTRRSDGSVLPKIQHTTIYSKAPPKGRERLKEGNDILREMRKKF